MEIDIVKTTPLYWDCECEDDFIHRDSEVQQCDKCGQHMIDAPNSRINEVNAELGMTVCENCGVDAITIIPGTTGYSNLYGEQDAPGWYVCHSCGHKDNF